MERIIAAEYEGLRSVSTTRVIEVLVHSPAVPSIDLMDLPGLKLKPGSNDALDMPQTVKDLVLAQIEKHRERAIFLVTCTASMPPEQSQAMQLMSDLGLQERTVGVFTMCDHLGRPAMKPLPGRLQQTAGGMPLQPHGYIATMTAPLDDDEAAGLSSLEKLRRQAAEERAFFESQPLLSPLLPQGLLTCDALVDKLNSTYLSFLLDTWAPQTLFRLNNELGRLRAANEALGLPEADAQLQGEALFSLREGACSAALAVLEEKMNATMNECFESSLTPLKIALVEALSTRPKGTSDLEHLQLKLLSETTRCVRETTALVVRDARAALAGDTSAFKLSRFPRFIEAVVNRLDTGKELHETRDGLSSLEWLARMVRDAASSVDDWVEECKAERLRLRAQMALVDPVKARTLELLRIESEAHVPQLVELQRVDLAQCTATGDGLQNARAGVPAIFTVQMQSHAGLPLSAVLRSPSGDAIRAAVTDKGGGKYEGRYTIPEAAEEGATWQLAVKLHGCGIQGSPFDVILASLPASQSAWGVGTTVFIPGHGYATIESYRKGKVKVIFADGSTYRVKPTVMLASEEEELAPPFMPEPEEDLGLDLGFVRHHRDSDSRFAARRQRPAAVRPGEGKRRLCWREGVQRALISRGIRRSAPLAYYARPSDYGWPADPPLVTTFTLRVLFAGPLRVSTTLAGRWPSVRGSFLWFDAI